MTTVSSPPKNDTWRVPPSSPEPVVDVHHEEIASGERNAASTASGDAAMVLVAWKLSLA